MALADLKSLVAIPRTFPYSPSSILMDADGETCSLIFWPTVSGNITGASVLTGSTSTTSQIRGGIQGVNTANGLNDGTWLGSGNAYQDFTPNATALHTLTFGAAAAVTAGNPYALVMAWPGAANGFVRFQTYAVQHILNVLTTAGQPQNIYNIEGGAKTTGNYPMCAALSYNGIYYDIGVMPPVANNQTAIQLDSDSGNHTTPARLGNRFRLPYSARLVGAAFTCDQDLDVDVKLYSDAGTELASGTAMDYVRAIRTAKNNNIVGLPAYTLAADTWYRIALVARSTDPWTYADWCQFSSNEVMAASSGGSDFYYTTYNGSAWADTTTKRAVISILIDQIDAAGAAAAGGGCSIVGGSIVRRA